MSAFYGTKPPRPTGAYQVTYDIRERSHDKDVRLVDMGKGSEYRFAGGEADAWEDRVAHGVTQLKQRTFKGWWLIYLAKRRKHAARQR